MKNLKFAVIRADLNSSESTVISQHRTEHGADRALNNLGNVAQGYYVAHRKVDGEFETRLEARDRVQR